MDEDDKKQQLRACAESLVPSMAAVGKAINGIHEALGRIEITERQSQLSWVSVELDKIRFALMGIAMDLAIESGDAVAWAAGDKDE